MMKGKRNVSVKHIVFMCIFMLVGLISISGTIFSETEVHAKTEEKNSTKKKERFVVDSKGRIGNYARHNEKMELVTTVTNNGEDFTGYIQVIMINEDYGKNVMYQADLVLAAGETKAVSQEIRWTGNSNRIMVHITDKKEKSLAAKKVKTSLLNQGECLIGILSDNKQEMGYWDSQKVAYLSKEDISSASAMGVMDVLVIDNFNTGDLEKEQYEAIKEWVELGGSLILGTGEQVSRTLAMFQDDYMTGRIGNAEKGIADISFQGEKLTDDLTDNMVFHKVEKGLGVISVANKSLGINKSAWNKKGYEYINAIENQYSIALQERLKVADHGNYSRYGYRSASYLRSTDEILSVKNFAVVLGAYIIIITIGTYLILKKKDKLEWTWAVVPVIGVIFSGVIIAIGSKTRISGTYMNYRNVMEFQEGVDSNAKNMTYINVTSSNNKDYEITVPEGMDVYAKSESYYDDDCNNELYKDYDIGFKNKDDQKVIALKNNQSFDSVELVAEAVETVEGSYQSDIYYLNATISGTFTNQTGVTIKNAILWAEGKLYKLGTIKPGEKVEITDKTPSIICNYNYGDYRWNRDFFEIAGVDADSKKWSLEEARYMDALEEFLDFSMDNISQNSAVYGYIDTDDDNMENKWGMPCYGITLTKFPIHVNNRTENGDIYVPDAFKEGEVISGDYYSAGHTMYLDEDSKEKFVMEYKLENNERLTGISFSKLLNPSIERNGFDGEIFEGKIEVYNWKTKQYETIFQADKEGVVTDVENYVGKGNVVRFQMNPDNKDYEEIYIPVISLTKEVKQNG